MLLVMSDSSTLTAGMVGAADPRFKGATMAVHSTLGFGAGFVSPLVFGAALDLAGGNQSITAWGIAFATLGARRARRPGAPRLHEAMTALSQRREWWLLVALGAVQFASVLDFMILMPLGAQLMRLFDLTPTEFGLLVSVYMITASAAGFAVSFVVDRFDRRAMLLVLCACFTATTVLTAMAQSYAWLLLARATAGAFGGLLMATVLAIVGDVVPDGRRGRALGLVMSAPSLASIVGIPVSIWLAAHFSWRAPFFLNTCICAAILAAAFLTVPHVRAHVEAARGRSALAQLGAVFGRRNHLRAFGLTMALNFSGFLIVPFIAPYFVANVGITETELTVTYFFGGVAALVFVRYVGRLTDLHGRRRTFVWIAGASTFAILVTTHLAAGRAVGRGAGPGSPDVDVSGALRAGDGDPAGRGGAGAARELHEPERRAAAALGRGGVVRRGRDGRPRPGRRADRLRCGRLAVDPGDRVRDRAGDHGAAGSPSARVSARLTPHGTARYSRVRTGRRQCAARPAPKEPRSLVHATRMPARRRS